MTLDDKFDPKKTDAVVIEHKRVMCAVHGTPFQAEWPRGYAIFAIDLIRECFADMRIVNEARRIKGRGADDKLEPKDIEPVLDIKPACCRVARAALIRIYEHTGIGVIARCSNCHRKRSGTPIVADNVMYQHLCFGCVASASSSPQDVQ